MQLAEVDIIRLVNWLLSLVSYYIPTQLAYFCQWERDRTTGRSRIELSMSYASDATSMGTQVRSRDKMTGIKIGCINMDRTDGIKTLNKNVSVMVLSLSRGQKQLEPLRLTCYSVFTLGPFISTPYLTQCPSVIYFDISGFAYCSTMSKQVLKSANLHR